ncbi:hypothetical protein [Paraburkholderia sediminicola]|uniref:hypothetical protein n=1 Tax=Paraburkholderia sediminicola TaxID=458836 RepID=UPI0038BD5CF6
MPKILCNVPDTQESILRPVVLDITRQIFASTAIPKDIQILFPGDLDRGQQPGASINHKDAETTRFPFNSRMSVLVTEEYLADRMLVNASFRPENNFIFRDGRIDTSIRPVYSGTQVTISFRYRAKDRTEAIRWRDAIRNRTSMNREQFVHDITYHYLIPLEQMVILKEIHRMREACAPYGEDWDQYFSDCRTTRATLLTNQAGAQGRWGIRETQLRVQGWFDFQGVPEAGAKEDDADTWTISFDYHFQYDKPLACAMYYPLMVHNQLLAQKFRPGPDEMPPDQEERHLRSYGLSAKMFSVFESGGALYPLTAPSGYAIPGFDEFVPASVIPSTLRIFTTLIGLDPANLRVLMNLNDTGGAGVIAPEIVDCLASEWAYMTQPLQSVFLVSLYQGADLVDPRFLAMDRELNITSTVDLDLRKTYHVRFALYQDWSQS